jgi:hypothetical protein
MSWFRSRETHFLEPEQENWLLEAFVWVAKQLGGLQTLSTRPIVLPNRAFFPSTDLEGHAKAEFVLDCIRRQMGMLEWPCNLIVQPERPGTRIPGMTYATVVSVGHAAGTFALSGNSAEITYDPANIDHPWRLIATLAHELAHYRLSAVSQLPPGGPDMLEPATDLTTILFGFGLFGANTAFEFSGHQDFQGQGWSSSRLGYLRERDWIFGLALFLAAGDKPCDPLRPYLKDHLWSDLRSARKSLRSRDHLLALLRASK